MSAGIDTAGVLDGAAVHAAGYTFAGRYLSSIPGPKIIRAEEAVDLRTHGVAIGLFYEDREDDMTLGSPAGLRNATIAAFEAVALGVTPGTVIYLANDRPTAPPLLVDYVAAAGPMLQRNGFARGFYGDPDTGRVLLDKRLVDAVWAVETWGSRDLSRCAIVQRVGAQVDVGGVTCDRDDLLGPAAGLWAPSVAPVPPPAVITAGLPNLFAGASGGYVAVLQRLLKVHGVASPVDGVFGPVTTELVRTFQQGAGLVVDGVVGPLTWAQLLT